MVDSTVSVVGGDDEINPSLLTFIEKYVNSFAKWDLIRFFHDLPYSVESAETVAHATGRDPDSVIQALQELTQLGLLESSFVQSGETLYMLTSDHAMRTLVNSFILACDNAQFRVRAIYHVIRALQTEIRN